MKKIKIIIVSIFVLTISTGALAQAVGDKFKVGDLYYRVTSLSPTATVETTYQSGGFPHWTATEKPTGDVVIPNSITYNGVKFEVTAIGYSSFIQCTNMTSITIPESVIKIKEVAFIACSGLTSITIPQFLTSIEQAAFKGCTNLISIYIPASVTSIEKQAFGGCWSLENIYLDSNNTSFIIEDGVLFNYDKTIIKKYPAGKPGTSYAIPESVTSIEDAAFDNCHDLVSITIPESVASIGDYAFASCLSLESIAIPPLVTSINYCTFGACISLTSFNIPESITSIGTEAFLACYGLTSITIPESVTSIGDCAFQNCSGLTSIIIPESVASIGLYAFKNCSSLISINIPESITSIKNGTFQNCSNLKSVTIPESVTSIGHEAFSECNSLTSITIPESVTSIGDWAFSECNSLTSIKIPEFVTSIGNSAFRNCTGLTSIVTNVPNPVSVSLGYEVFLGIPKGTDPNACALYVPEGSVELYENAEQWQDFMPYIGTTNIEEITQANIIIYPNPANDILNIKSDTPILSFEIYDALGRLVQSETEMYSTESAVNVSSLTRGIYFIRLHTTNSTAEYKVVIEN